MGIRGREKGFVVAALAGLAILLLAPALARGATFTVDLPNDAGGTCMPDPDPGTCTARQAVEGADAGAGPDVVVLTTNVALTLGELNIDGGGVSGDHLTIRGGGTMRSVTAAPTSRLIFSSGPLTLEDLELTGGQVTGTAQGGAIQFFGIGKTLRLDGVYVHDNTSAKDGGGLHVTAGGVLEVLDSRIEQNSAGHGVSGVSALGGGIHLTSGSIATIDNSRIAGNRAGTAAQPATSQGQGGGIYYQVQGSDPQTLTITDTVIEDNRAGGLGSVGNFNRGGGVSLENSNPAVNPVLSISGGEISGNTVGGGTGGARGSGGGVYAVSQGGSGAVTLDDVEISSNRAGGSDGVGDPAANNTAPGFGGGIFTDLTMTVSDSDLIGNLAGVVEGDPDRVISGAGGAIHMAQASPAANDFTIERSLVQGNRAGNGDGGGNGGGISAANEGGLTISDSTFAGNQATISGGAIQRFLSGTVGPGDPDLILRSSLTGNTSHGVGGAIELETPRVFAIDGSLLSGNQAIGATSWGGAISAGSSTADPDPRGKLRLLNSTVTGNSAGLPAPDEGLLPLGGGIILGTAGAMDFDAIFSTIAGNTVHSGPNTVPGPFGRGGNLHVNNATMDNEPTITFRGTIVSGGATTAPRPFPNCSFGSLVTPTSQGGNIEGLDANAATTTECGFSDGVLGDQVGIDPALAALSDNGGPTDTRRLLDGSPAIDTVPPAVCAGTTSDQRGYPRPFPAAGSCDSGAYELFTCAGSRIDQAGPFPGCPAPPGPPLPGAGAAPTPVSPVDRCQPLERKLKRAKKRLKAAKKADKPTKKKRKKVRKLRRELRALGC